MISLLELTEPPKGQVIVINEWGQPHSPLLITACPAIGFRAAALSGEEGAAVLNGGLGFLLLLLKVLRSDNVPDFLERGHRDLRWMVVAALMLPIII